MTDKEFVAEINSKCKNLVAGFNDRGMFIMRKDGKSMVCLFYRSRCRLNAYGIMRRENGRVHYIDIREKQYLIEKLKKAIESVNCKGRWTDQKE